MKVDGTRACRDGSWSGLHDPTRHVLVAILQVGAVMVVWSPRIRVVVGRSDQFSKAEGDKVCYLFLARSASELRDRTGLWDDEMSAMRN